MTKELITARLVDSAPEQYQTSQIYYEIQRSAAAELAKVAADNEDLRRQLFVRTATWGLYYWESQLRIPVVTADSYPIRRSRVLAKLRAYGNFSAEQVKSIASSYSNGEVAVAIDFDTGVITVTFVGSIGIPPNIEDLEKQLGDIVHAHLELTYVFRYLTWDMIDAGNLTWDQIDALQMTWDEVETWEPKGG